VVKRWGKYSRFIHSKKQLRYQVLCLFGDAKIRHIPYLQGIHSLKCMKAVMTINTKLITPRRQYSARSKGVLGLIIWKQTAESAQPFMCPLGLLMWPPRHQDWDTWLQGPEHVAERGRVL